MICLLSLPGARIELHSCPYFLLYISVAYRASDVVTPCFSKQRKIMHVFIASQIFTVIASEMKPFVEITIKTSTYGIGLYFALFKIKRFLFEEW